MKRSLLAAALVLVLFLIWFFNRDRELSPPVPVMESGEEAVPLQPSPPDSSEKEAPPEKKEKPKTKEKPTVFLPSAPPPKEKPIVKPPPEMAPPPVEIHEELIPRNIEIIRVYYASEITGPGSSIGFDINGSGFTKEFEQMIEVKSGHPKVDVKDLKLMTPNQIHGNLVTKKSAPTTVIYPQVLIQGKVVFQAPQPFAVIRRGEVLNLIFTQMGENGRSGQFRVFTNLSKRMFKKFKVTPSTPTIQVKDLKPRLPFLVDGTILIGAAPTGAYGMTVTLKKKVLWENAGNINIVKPNLEGTGLVQRLVAVDGFHRPGDQARFIIQGSGFKTTNPALLRAKVEGWDSVKSTITYIAPGRMDIVLEIPLTAGPSVYTLILVQGEKTVTQGAKAFYVVPENWTRSISVDPPLRPGGQSQLVLQGRSLLEEFVSQIKIEVDEPGLSVGPFKLTSPEKAVADISSRENVAPGDYWIKLSYQGKSVVPQNGSIIRIEK